jgi:hypothetical protein
LGGGNAAPRTWSYGTTTQQAQPRKRSPAMPWNLIASSDIMTPRSSSHEWSNSFSQKARDGTHIVG